MIGGWNALPSWYMRNLYVERDRSVLNVVNLTPTDDDLTIGSYCRFYVKEGAIAVSFTKM